MHICEICEHGWCRWCARGICECFPDVVQLLPKKEPSLWKTFLNTVSNILNR
jgi:hypothetical protein